MAALATRQSAGGPQLAARTVINHAGAKPEAHIYKVVVDIARETRCRSREGEQAGWSRHTMRFGSTAKVLANCKLKYYKISECGTSCACLLMLTEDPIANQYGHASGKNANLRSHATRTPGSTRDSLLPSFCLTHVQTDLQYKDGARGECCCQKWQRQASIWGEEGGGGAPHALAC